MGGQPLFLTFMLVTMYEAAHDEFILIRTDRVAWQNSYQKRMKSRFFFFFFFWKYKKKIARAFLDVIIDEGGGIFLYKIRTVLPGLPVCFKVISFDIYAVLFIVSKVQTLVIIQLKNWHNFCFYTSCTIHFPKTAWNT